MFNAHTKLATKISLLLATGIASAVFASQAGAAGMERTAASYGAAESAADAGRVVTITPTTKWINVDDGETVTFVKGDTRFTWHFDTLRGAEDVQLALIAPPALMADGITVAVGSNPLYRN